MINCSWLSTTFIITYVFLPVCFSMAPSNLKIPGDVSAACVSSPSPLWAQASLEQKETEIEFVPRSPSLLFIFAVLFCSGCCNKLHKLGGLANWNWFTHSSRGLKSKIKVPAGLVSPEAFLLGLQMATFLLCLHMAFSLCTHSPVVSSSSYKDVYPAGLRLHTDDLT